LGTGFKIRAIAQRPEPLSRPVRRKAEDDGFYLAPRLHWPRHHYLRLPGRKRRPTGRFLVSAAPIGASIFRSEWYDDGPFGFRNQPPLSRRFAPNAFTGVWLDAKPSRKIRPQPGFSRMAGVAAGFGTMNDQPITIGERHGWGESQPFGISAKDERQHLYIIGKTGSGKTTLAAQPDFAAYRPWTRRWRH
jgi:hypothetical protein